MIKITLKIENCGNNYSLERRIAQCYRTDNTKGLENEIFNIISKVNRMCTDLEIDIEKHVPQPIE